jgi:hypothetical protein
MNRAPFGIIAFLGICACAVLVCSGQPGAVPDVPIPEAMEAKDETIRMLEGHNEQLKRELLFLRIAECESTFNPEARNGEYYGKYQFKKATWDWMCQRSGLDHLEYNNPADQELLARWALANGLQEHFECYQIVTEKWPSLALEMRE